MFFRGKYDDTLMAWDFFSLSCCWPKHTTSQASQKKSIMFPILEKAGGDDDDIVTLQLFCHLFIQIDAKECGMSMAWVLYGCRGFTAGPT